MTAPTFDASLMLHMRRVLREHEYLKTLDFDSEPVARDTSLEKMLGNDPWLIYAPVAGCRVAPRIIGRLLHCCRSCSCMILWRLGIIFAAFDM